MLKISESGGQGEFGVDRPDVSFNPSMPLEHAAKACQIWRDYHDSPWLMRLYSLRNMCHKYRRVQVKVRPEPSIKRNSVQQGMRVFLVLYLEDLFHVLV
jgi:hypothetical protein